MIWDTCFSVTIRLIVDDFNNKISDIMPSKLKIRMPIFSFGQVVKVRFPGQAVRFGTIAAKSDSHYKLAVRVKFTSESISVNKNHICIPRFQKHGSEPVL